MRPFPVLFLFRIFRSSSRSTYTSLALWHIIIHIYFIKLLYTIITKFCSCIYSLHNLRRRRSHRSSSRRRRPLSLLRLSPFHQPRRQRKLIPSLLIKITKLPRNQFLSLTQFFPRHPLNIWFCHITKLPRLFRPTQHCKVDVYPNLH